MDHPETERIRSLPKIYIHNREKIERAINLRDYQEAKRLNDFLYELTQGELDEMYNNREKQNRGIDIKIIDKTIKLWEEILGDLSEQGVIIARGLNSN